MSKLSLVIPTVGLKNTVACPEVDTALSTIQTWANGEVDGTNSITAESITEANFNSAVKTLLNTKSSFALSLVKKNEAEFTAATGELVFMEKTGSTLKLPAATLNRIVGVWVGSGTTGVKVTAPVVETIFGDFIIKATTIVLESNQHVILQADGTNWLIMAGEPKREQTYAATVTETVNKALSATRPVFVTTNGLNSPYTVGGVTVEGNSFIVPPGQVFKSAGSVKYNTLIL